MYKVISLLYTQMLRSESSIMNTGHVWAHLTLLMGLSSLFLLLRGIIILEVTHIAASVGLMHCIPLLSPHQILSCLYACSSSPEEGTLSVLVPPLVCTMVSHSLHPHLGLCTPLRFSHSP